MAAERPVVGSNAEALTYATVRRLPALFMLVVAGAAALSASVAIAESAPTLDCVQHGRLTRHYSSEELRTALQTMPAEVKEYNSECYQLILNQLDKQLGTTPVTTPTTTSGTGGSGSSLLSAPLLIVLCVIVLAGGGFVLAARRRGDRSATEDDQPKSPEDDQPKSPEDDQPKSPEDDQLKSPEDDQPQLPEAD